ncbi:MAG: LysM peptidoglycan-binding domain-containing protein [Cellvibrionaceae bacterium]
MQNNITYTVAPRDCLWNLASRFYGKGSLWPVIFKYNNQPDVVKQTGSRILDPDLILIGQTLIIPSRTLAEKVDEKELTKTKDEAEKNRHDHANKGKQEQQQIQRIRQSQPQPPGGREPMGQRYAKKVAAPAYQFDLGESTLSAIKGPGFTLKASLSGSLMVQDTHTSAIGVTAKDLKQLEISTKQQTETVAGKLISDVKFNFDPKNKTIKLSGGIASQSNIAGTPVIKLDDSVNQHGQPVLKGSVTYNIVKGQVQHYAFAGEKISFTIEATPDKDIERKYEDSNVWEELGATHGAFVLVVGAAALVVVTIIEDCLTLGAGVVDDPASFALAAAMIISARHLFKRYTSRLGRRIAVSTGAIFATPMAMATDEVDTGIQP